MRFICAAGLIALLAASFAGGAAALDFNDEAEEAPVGEVGKVYHFEMPSHGGCFFAPYRYVVESGVLPAGLKLGNLPFTNLTGLIDGVPTESGTFSAWIALKDVCNQSAELLFTFVIWERRWGIATQSLAPATAGSPYSAKLEAAGVPSTTKWELRSGALPAGVTLGADGTVSGTPTAAASSTFTVQATGDAMDFSGTRIDSRQLTLDVREPLTTRLSRRVAEVGIPFRATLTATGGLAPHTWSATGLPTGVTLASDTLAGTPAAAGSFRAQITVIDAGGAAKTTDVTLTVARRLAIATKALRGATIGRSYGARLVATGGVRPFRWSIARGRLPSGIRLDGVKGTLNGRATATGSSSVTIRVRDSLGAVSTRTFALSTST